MLSIDPQPSANTTIMLAFSAKPPLVLLETPPFCFVFFADHFRRCPRGMDEERYRRTPSCRPIATLRLPWRYF